MNHENLWAPWRSAYLRELTRRADEIGEQDAPSGSFLVAYFQSPGNDAQNHVIHRDAHGMVLLNRYPYSNGHLLIALGDARPTLLEYEPDQRAAFWTLIERGMKLMQQAINPQGINVGINQGSAAGAGIPEHLHAHLVPRWSGDTNFMSVVGQVRVVPDSLTAMAAQYERVAGEV